MNKTHRSANNETVLVTFNFSTPHKEFGAYLFEDFSSNNVITKEHIEGFISRVVWLRQLVLHEIESVQITHLKENSMVVYRYMYHIAVEQKITLVEV